MTRRGPDAGTLLGRALVGDAARAGCAVTIDATAAVAWQSATFAGARHTVTLSGAASPQLTRWLAGIGTVEFDLRGHFVADIVVDMVRVTAGRCEAVLAALTVADDPA